MENLNITEEEEILIDKLHTIKNSEEVREIIRCLYAHAENAGATKIKNRIKREESALTKFKTKNYDSAEKMEDLCGLMVLVENEEDIYNITAALEKVLPSFKETDYVQTPKAGYRSMHINSTYKDVKDLEGYNLPMEIQIKTMPMYIAQESIHNSVYKNYDLDEQTRTRLSTNLFPIIEKSVEMKNHLRDSNLSKAIELQEEILELRKANEDILKNYPDIINTIWKNVATISYKESINDDFELDSFLSQDTVIEKKSKEAKLIELINKDFDHIYTNQIFASPKNIEISGDPKLDATMDKLDNMSKQEFYKLNIKIKEIEQNKEEIFKKIEKDKMKYLDKDDLDDFMR